MESVSLAASLLDILMKHFKQLYHRLSLPEKILAISLVLGFIFTFFDWFYQIQISPTINEAGNYEEALQFNAYNGIAAVTGYFYALFTLTTLLSLLLSVHDKYLQNFLSKNHWFYLFLTGESLFLLILTFLIYTNYSLQFTKAGIKSGLILAIIANLGALFSAHFYFLKNRRRNIKKSFQSQMQETVNLEPDIPTPSEKAKDDTRQQMSFADYH
jgi:hypothetical protein